jgi:AraC family transcriptional regulator, regulatory protein of adaptative response / methylated-DNA-[protein]-cysteine methyltransferase
MISQELTNYERIARAIEYLKLNFKRQPSLEEVAENVYLSPFHFQRMFTEWAGVSPKKFTQYLSVEYPVSQCRICQSTIKRETSFPF